MVTRPSSPAATVRSMLTVQDYVEGYRRASIERAWRADSSDAALRDRERVAEAIPPATNLHGSSGASGSHPRCSKRDTPRISAHPQQAPSPVTSLEKNGAENPVLRKASGEGVLECIHLINPLADKRAFIEHILVDIRGGARIGIDARITPLALR